MKRALTYFLIMSMAGAPGIGSAAPVSFAEAATAAVAFARLHFTSSPHVASPPAADTVVTMPLVRDGTNVAILVDFQPHGYVIMRMDDLLPPVKLYSDAGIFSNTPPAFRDVVTAELAGERAFLDTLPRTTTTFKTQWQRLLASAAVPRALAHAEISAGPLLSTVWNQDYPYNLYAPPAPGGPGGKAYAGCVASALAQIMRYHQWPVAVTTNHSYYDGDGSCVGTHAMDDAGLNEYQWQHMPNAINAGSATAQKQAIGQLIYHCGVGVDMDFEASGSGAYSESVPGALQTYFLYNASHVRRRSSYDNAAWYRLMATNIMVGRPMFYAFQSSGGGHAVVCDGVRNDTDIHLNFGWGGYANAWYNMDNVNGGGESWTLHSAVTDIAPKQAALSVHTAVPQNDTDGDGHLEPAESFDLVINVRNTGGLGVDSVTGQLASLTGNISISGDAMQPFGTIAAGGVGSNQTPYHLNVAVACPAGPQPLQLVLQAGTSVWTNTLDVLVEYLPRISVAPTNVVLFTESGISSYDTIVVSNAGIGTLSFYVSDGISNDSTNYTLNTSAEPAGPLYVWQDISAHGIPVRFESDDGVSQMIELGFAFPFFGKQYSQILIGANGALGLSNGIVYRTNRALPAGEMYAPAQMIAPLWCDLEPLKGGTVLYYGDDMQFIASWQNVPRVGAATGETFQAILRRNGDIVFQYKALSANPTNTIGVQAGHAGPMLQASYNAPLAHDELALLIAPARGDSWLRYAPVAAGVAVNASTTLLVTCDSGQLTSGLYRTLLTLIHNDPRVPPVSVPVEFIVPESGITGVLLGCLVYGGCLRARRWRSIRA